MGWTNPAVIINAFKNDNHLLGRLMAMVLAVIELNRWWSGKIPQVLTCSKFLTQYFIRTRGYDGHYTIRVNATYCRSHPCKEGTIEFMLVSMVEKDMFN
ncbi:hypothetical protein FRB95_003782 [Tulasnella sp. JGI-2019a]|nr:hypothetical protein FRB95_003782 [Tulasnella sp. JGI-2019a]